MIFSRVSETTLGTFPGHFWSVLGTKLGGVSAFRVVSMSRAVAADVKAKGRDKTVVTKAGKRSFFLGFEGRQKIFFSRVLEATLGTFPGPFWSVFGMKLGGVSAFRVVSMSRARQRQQPSSMLQFPHVFSSSRIPEVSGNGSSSGSSKSAAAATAAAF